MSLNRSSIKSAIKRAVVAVGGPSGAAHVKAVTQAIAPDAIPVPERPWAAPAAGEVYGTLATEHESVRIAPPRGELVQGTGRYPAAVPGPRVPRGRRALPRPELEYCPERHVKEHPTRWEFPAYLDNPSCRWLQAVKALYADPLSFPSSLSPEAGLLVHSLVRNIRPRVVIETGTFIGMSTIWVAAALQENGDGGVVHSFDDFSPILKAPWRDVELRSGRLEYVARNIARAGLAEHVVLHPGNSSFEVKGAHPEIRAAGGAQLAFLDADHGVLGVWQDFWAAEPVLNTGGFVLLHDTFPEFCSYDGPRHLLDHVNDHSVGLYEKMDLYLSPQNYGLGLLRRVG